MVDFCYARRAFTGEFGDPTPAGVLSSKRTGCPMASQYRENPHPCLVVLRPLGFDTMCIVHVVITVNR